MKKPFLTIGNTDLYSSVALQEWNIFVKKNRDKGHRIQNRK